MARSLPPLKTLQAFEAAGRHLSFTKAADELNVTPAAISQQIKNLEGYVGTSLFHRLPRSLRLTQAGESALPNIRQAFDTLENGVEQMVVNSSTRVLTISVSPSFGAMWLVPRLEDFRSAHPDFDIRIDGTDQLVDVNQNEADIALRYGPGGYPGVNADFLFQPVNTPVCSPELKNGEPGLNELSDLRHHTLLHIDWMHADASWRMWLLAAGLLDINPARGPRYTMESMAVQAAVDGQGVALVADILVKDEIAAGRLVRPFADDLSTPLDFSYYLITARNREQQPGVSAFREWVLKEARDCGRP